MRNVITIALVALALCIAPARAQDKPVKIFVGFAPGAGTDTLARLVADKMRVALNVPVIIDNRPAVGGMQATLMAKASAPDGLTFILQPLAPMVAFPFTHEKLDYDPVKDFAPVAHLAEFQLALGVAAKLPARTVAEYVAFVKKDSANAFFGSTGLGGLPQFFGMMLGKAAGLELTHVPYKGSAPALQALIGGSVPAIVVPLPDLTRFARSGQARILAVSGAKRPSSYPDAPTFREAGYDIEGSGWYALFAPAGTSGEAIGRVSKAAIAAVHAPDVRERLDGMGLEPTGLAPAELAAVMKRDSERWGPVIKASGFKASN